MPLGPVLLGAQEGKGRLVAHPHELAAGEAIERLDFLPEYTLDQRLGEDVGLLAGASAHVDELGIDGDRRIGDQRPRRRRPHEQQVPGMQRPARLHHRELHVHRRVDDVLIAEGDLVRAQRRLVAGAVGHDLVALDQQTAIPDLA